ncbi:uncharacterized protein [Ambystoma mexicanum]|uniref:uncharacterized protein n=1 Tax=Ambystoma mexicanum TaxID=8296 RepID=UPI0037E80F7F
MFQDSPSEATVVEVEIHTVEEEEEEEVQVKKRKRTMTAKAKANKEQAGNTKRSRQKGRAQKDVALTAPTPAEAPGNHVSPPSTPATRTVDVAVERNTSLEIVKGFYIRLAPKSGLAWEFGLDFLAGVIEPDVREEMKVLLQNHGETPFEIRCGDKITQRILEKALFPCFKEESEPEETERLNLGFGEADEPLLRQKGKKNL